MSSPSEGGFAILLMRTLRGWNQTEMAKKIGTAPSVISKYENGKRLPSIRTLEKVAQLADISAHHFRALLPLLGALSNVFAEASPDDLKTLVEQVGRESQALSAVTADLLLSTGQGRKEAPPPAPEDRRKAQALWKRLRALCELLCKLSAEERDAGRARELAELALLAAELAPGPEPWRQRLQGYAWVCVSRAREAGGDRDGDREASARSRPLWEAGAAGDPGGLLGEPGG